MIPSRYAPPSRFAPPRRLVVGPRQQPQPEPSEGILSGIPIVGGLLDGLLGGGGASQQQGQQQNGGGGDPITALLGGLLGGGGGAGGGLGGLLGGLAPLLGTALGGPLGGMAGGLVGNLLGGLGGGGAQNAASNPTALITQLLGALGPVAGAGGQLLSQANVAQALAPALTQAAATTVQAISPQLNALLGAQQTDAMRQQATAEHRTLMQQDTRHQEVMQGLQRVQQTVGAARTVQPARF